MVKLLFAIGALCCFIAVSAAAAQQAGVLDQARQGAELAQGATLRSIRTFPAKLVSTIDRTQTWCERISVRVGARRPDRTFHGAERQAGHGLDCGAGSGKSHQSHGFDGN
jgi:hypothetical protein